MKNQININTRVSGDMDRQSVKRAIEALLRDIKSTCLESDEPGLDISVVLDGQDGETFIAERKDNELLITSGGELGLIYGIYHVSKIFLGVEDFWFWNEQELVRKKEHVVPDNYHYESEPYKVRFRGWFINDEVLFDGWRAETGDDFPWEMAFEALLRCGGNMTIPGTDHNSHKYRDLAVEYGLYITHHHAEPLGARMFARAYPELEASFDRYPDLFRGLWREGIEDQKNCKVIWNLGFRGQGDRPFWADDPTYDTPKARGELMSRLILEQYNLVRESDPEAVCCTNLYGETMELYREGYLTFPEEVIKIWADNGYGRMVSRRQNNHNPRVFALPDKGDRSAHGIYYHASFYDLQAAAMMTMMPNSPEFVVKELNEVYERGVNDFWIINCSNIKPHTYYLDLIAGMWREGSVTECSADEFVREHLREYVDSYYRTEFKGEIENAYRIWPACCPQYGENEDDHAGEQFSNHGARVLACGFMTACNREEPDKTKAITELDWICPAGKLSEQVAFHEDKYHKALDGYKEYLDECLSIRDKLLSAGDEGAAGTFDNSLICQIQYHYHSYLGALHICRAIRMCLDKDMDDEKYISAFYEAGLAAKAFLSGYETMRSHEHDIWKGFYANDCEADIRQSGFVAKSLMSYIRVLGDGPHFYKWQRRFQPDAGGDKVLLILRLKAHLTDDEMWELMDGRIE